MPNRDPEKRRAYQREYDRQRPRPYWWRTDIVGRLTAQDRKMISEALQELCPDGLTDECPARSSR
jgi:hypothetical protein